VADGKEGTEHDSVAPGTIQFSPDGRSLSYLVHVGKADKDGKASEEGFLVIDGKARTKYARIAPWPNTTVYHGKDTISYVAVRDGAYYWVEEKRTKE